MTNYALAVGVGFFGLSWAAVPLYRIYCQSTGTAGQAFRDKNADKIQFLKVDKERMLRIKFVADTASKLVWKFKPTMTQIDVNADLLMVALQVF